MKPPAEIFEGFNLSGLARELDIDRTNFYKWSAVPLNYVTKLSNLTGIPKEVIRPDYDFKKGKFK